MLLITSPHNPTGRLYSPKALLAAIAWGRKRGLHIIVDEVNKKTRGGARQDMENKPPRECFFLFHPHFSGKSGSAFSSFYVRAFFPFLR